jgi:hypothetical protein
LDYVNIPMKTYTVLGKRAETFEEEFAAESPQDAVKAFEAKFPKVTTEYVAEVHGGEDWFVVGHDELTGDAIFESDEYQQDEDGCMTLISRAK